MVRATGTAPVCSCSRSRRLTSRLRSEELPSALNPASGHYFDRARSLPAYQVQLGKRKWSSIRVLRPVFRFGRPACISQHLCSKKWSPVRELHPPERFCRPLPRLLGQRDIRIRKNGVQGAERASLARNSPTLESEWMVSHPPAFDQLSAGGSGAVVDLPFFNGTKPPGIPSTSVLPAVCAAASDCIRRKFIKAGLPSSNFAALARLRSAALSPRARSSAACPSCLDLRTSAKARFNSAGNMTSFTSTEWTVTPILAASRCTRARSCAPISSRWLSRASTTTPLTTARKASWAAL